MNDVTSILCNLVAVESLWDKMDNPLARISIAHHCQEAIEQFLQYLEDKYGKIDYSSKTISDYLTLFRREELNISEMDYVLLKSLSNTLHSWKIAWDLNIFYTVSDKELTIVKNLMYNMLKSEGIVLEKMSI